MLSGRLEAANYSMVIQCMISPMNGAVLALTVAHRED
jgi:hypothetical protein